MKKTLYKYQTCCNYSEIHNHIYYKQKNVYKYNVSVWFCFLLHIKYIALIILIEFFWMFDEKCIWSSVYFLRYFEFFSSSNVKFCDLTFPLSWWINRITLYLKLPCLYWNWLWDNTSSVGDCRLQVPGRDKLISSRLPNFNLVALQTTEIWIISSLVVE